MEISAIIVAAGSSQRMGFDKLAAPLHGTPVLAHTLAAFMLCDAITEIILVCPATRLAALLDPSTFTKPVLRTDGSTARHLSVARGLAATSPSADLIAIHDAARPLISQADILATIAAAKTHGAASLARRVTETLQLTDPSDFTTTPLPRENLWFIETPQIFHAPLIRRAYAHILENNIPVTDETSALQALGKTTKLIPSTSPNPKITTPADLTSLHSPGKFLPPEIESP